MDSKTSQSPRAWRCLERPQEALLEAGWFLGKQNAAVLVFSCHQAAIARLGTRCDFVFICIYVAFILTNNLILYIHHIYISVSNVWICSEYSE